MLQNWYIWRESKLFSWQVTGDLKLSLFFISLIFKKLNYFCFKNGLCILLYLYLKLKTHYYFEKQTYLLNNSVESLMHVQSICS
jgi:hypothetical protein